MNRLMPRSIASSVFSVDLDRDERASPLFNEMLLTLVANHYTMPNADDLKSPKLRRFATRSLAFGVNFLKGVSQPLPGSEMTSEAFGDLLAAGADFQGSVNLDLVQHALQNLVDPTTERGAQRGERMLLPFHEDLLWYDAREGSGRYTTRRVRMRGSGISLARLLLDPPATCSEETRVSGASVAGGLRDLLTTPSPLASATRHLEECLPADAFSELSIEPEDLRAWQVGADVGLSRLAEKLCRHADGIIGQHALSGPDRLWQLRTVTALDVALDVLRCAWEQVGTPPRNRALTLAVPGQERQHDRIRLQSEKDFTSARVAIDWAIVRELKSVLEHLHGNGGIDWRSEMDSRTLRKVGDTVVEEWSNQRDPDFQQVAQRLFESAAYGRSREGFRVLIESIGMSAGGTRYRYLSAPPSVLAALVGALAKEMPMTSTDFFVRVFEEWNLVISPEAATGTHVAEEVDGAPLKLNARRVERLLTQSGLASSLSDRTVLVGETSRRGDK